MADHDEEPALAISLDNVLEAAQNIQGEAIITPVMTSSTMDSWAGRSLFFKCENFQRVGAFKFRGALNAIRKLPKDVTVVVTHSSGNHAQALALAAKVSGLEAQIVMPTDAPACKRAAVADYGAQITDCAPDKRVEVAAEVQKRHPGSVQIPSYNYPDVMAGQGTTGLELISQIPNLDAVIVPVGGGGLISGIATAVKGLKPSIKVIGAEPANADDCARSKAAGERIPLDKIPNTIADGLKTSLGTLTWPIIEHKVDKIITVPEDQIISGMRHVWERMKLVIEPSAGVPVAVALGDEFKKFADENNLKRIGVILCGGNQDIDKLPWMSK